MFISFEGLEGSGKSTQTELLTGRLREEEKRVVATREPGGTRIGEQIRAITHNRDNVDLTARAEAYLMAAARAQHVGETIGPALEEGTIVVCDRFIDSSLAYQGYGRELGVEKVWELNRMALERETTSGVEDFKRPGLNNRPELSSLLLPDLTFYLKVGLEEAMERRNGTEKIDRLDLQQQEFYGRVEKGYNELAKKYKERIVVVDGSREVQKVAEEVWQLISKKMI